jgi:hypothetical protein
MLSQLWKRMRALVVVTAADKDNKKRHTRAAPVGDF